jgi:glycine betaine/proline transport system ATP-binding protein
VDDERRFIGMCEVEEVARLAERGERELRTAVDTTMARVDRSTWLREVLPLFVERDVPVAVVGKDEHLEGVIVRGSLIAGLTTSSEQPHEAGVLLDSRRPEDATLRGSEASQETGGGR